MNRFLEADYKPTETEVVVHYHVLPLRKDSFHEELHHLIEGLQIEESLVPKIFDVNVEYLHCKIAFSEELFEPGNLAQNLAIIAGNMFENSDGSSVKILSIRWSRKLEKNFPGPHQGLEGIREQLQIFDRPLSSAVLLPKTGLPLKDYLGKAYQLWMGGCDIVAESELMTSIKQNEFQERVEFLSKERSSCADRTKQSKAYIPNITAGSLTEMSRRAKIAKDWGLEIVAVNGTHIGWTGLTDLIRSCQELDLALTVLQAGHGVFTKGAHLGFSAVAIASLYRLLGADAVSIDHPSLESTTEVKTLTDYNLYKSSFPIYSGTIHPQDVAGIIKKHGYDLIIQTGKPIYQHPDGIKAGAEAFQYAIEAATQGIEINSAAQRNEPLRRALEIRNS